jgi:magnesium-transporting ATPase (P-type)
MPEYLVTYTGKQSKIQLNSKRASQKSSNLEKVANQVLAAVLTFELCLCVTAVVASQLWSSAAENKAMWHLPEPDNVVGIFFVYLILLNNYVPISLYFTMELAKLGQKVLIASQLGMYLIPQNYKLSRLTGKP